MVNEMYIRSSLDRILFPVITMGCPFIHLCSVHTLRVSSLKLDFQLFITLRE